MEFHNKSPVQHAERELVSRGLGGTLLRQHAKRELVSKNLGAKKGSLSAPSWVLLSEYLDKRIEHVGVG